ncbi:PIG-L family deacetylase [Paracoccus aminophilus]|uniref:LmbE family protein n=1 Tax=Paracoccus aminophilus JCM 7686 TaxID=1367847 RepID=S5YX66_PARAH|nr:PIG-L family deacetylase [Paracoccus aminophilus]AGT09811.1 hypothetical protein JCM7686_2755 [Paracoccus aminophilus JCM 7686]
MSTSEITTRADLAALQRRFLAFPLERALSRLGAVISVMNTGAHPDDEHSGLLAWLRFGRGFRIAIASSTRGEGGQNLSGPERGGRLGLLRSHEMERAAEVLDAELHWLGFGPSDPVHDFGFSKSGTDTLRRWGGPALITDRLVRLFRAARPDVVLPTFLDVPGQHGHHRAMTEAALAAWHLAGDPGHVTPGLAPWRPAKFYLPAWSGGGATYDDEVPPPPATLILRAAGVEPLTGASWLRLGEASRLCHASQDMGDPTRDGAQDWPLHLVDGGPETDLADGLALRLSDLPDGPAELRELAELFDAAKAAPRAKLVAILGEADRCLAGARATQTPEFAATHGHRLDWQKRALDQAMLLASGDLPRRIAAMAPVLPAGRRVGLDIDRAEGIELVLPEGVSLEVGEAGFSLAAQPDVVAAESFRAGWAPLGGNGAISARLSAIVEGRIYRAALDLAVAPEIKPASASDLAQGDLILRRQDGQVAWPLPLDLPEGVTLAPDPASLGAPGGPGLRRLAAGRIDLTPQRQGIPLTDWQKATTAEGRALHLAAPRRVRLLALDLALPEARIGYIPGSDDSLGALRLAGFAPELLGAPGPGALTGFDTVLIGTVAFGMVAGLREAAPELRRFVAEGGHLVTFYQRPDQGWSPDLGPGRLDIGTPSLRWRVTDPEAAVTLLDPAHPLLAGPNRIGPEDWQGWDKERGLYFAARWDSAYHPLLAMSDPGEAPLTGALISGRFGKGRHSHVALTLHHQMAQFVPGAFRLMANLLAPA